MHIYPNLTIKRTYNDQTFESLNLRKTLRTSTPLHFSDFCRDISAQTGLELSKVKEFVKILNGKQRNFLDAIAKRYNRENYFFNGTLKEDPNIIFEIFNSIEKPNKNHYYMLKHIEGSMGFLEKILPHADERTIEAINILQDKIFKNRTAPKRFISDIIQSPYRKTYIDDIYEFQSYLLLNKDNPNAIKELDLLMKNKSYSSEYFNKEYNIRNVMNSITMSSKSSITKEQIEKNYSTNGIYFLENFVYSYYSRRPFNLSKESEEILLNIYTTTNSKNINIRNSILEKFKYKFENDEQATAIEIKSMQSLFKKIDKNGYAKKFVEEIIEQVEDKSVPIGSIKILDDILENIPPEQLYIFRENVYDIIRKAYDTNGLIKIIKENITNPFFETSLSREAKYNAIKYGHGKPESIFSKMRKAITNKINEFRYSLIKEKPVERAVSQPVIIEETVQPVAEKQIVREAKTPIIEDKTEQVMEKVQLPPLKEILSSSTGNKIFDLSQLRLEPYAAKHFVWNTQKCLPLPAEKQTSNIDLPPIKELINNTSNILPIKLEHIIPNSAGEPSVTITNTIKESPKARKLRLIGEVNEFISKKLGAKTLSEQSDIYSKNATKMRLKLLPEIFASIKETRQIDRSVGKLKSNSTNKDAVELYRLINGSNRKYIKYLLEKRNVDGTRMFEVKDIISMIEKANKHVDTMKKANPDFKAKDAKAYFDHLYNAKIEQYGKVKKARKK